MVAPVDGEGARALLERSRHARLHQRVEYPTQALRWLPVGDLLLERRDEQCEGALDLAVGERVPPVRPANVDAEGASLVAGQREQCVEHAGEVRRAAVTLGEKHSEQQRAHAQLARSHADGQERLEARGHPRKVNDRLEPGKSAHRRPVSRRTVSSSPAGAIAPTRSPSR